MKYYLFKKNIREYGFSALLDIYRNFRDFSTVPRIARQNKFDSNQISFRYFTVFFNGIENPYSSMFLKANNISE